MAQSPETVRLHNVGMTQLSLHLLYPVPKGQPRLRRGMSLLPIRILPGRYYDIAKELGCSLDEAREYAKSPEVVAHKNAGRLLIREFPPSAEQLTVEAAAQAKADDAQARTNALSPPDPPNAIPAGVDPAAAGLPLDTPRTWRWPGDQQDEAPKLYRIILQGFDPAREIEVARELRNMLETSLVDVKQLLDLGGVVKENLQAAEAKDLRTKLSDLGADVEIEPMTVRFEPSAPDADDEPAADELVAAPVTETAQREPSMDWSIEELTKYAAEHAPPIDLGTAKTKTAILKKIRKATSIG